MNTGFRGPSIPFRSIHRLIQSVLPQLTFSFYRHQPILADFSGGQITSDAGLLPLRAFDQRHHLTRELAQLLTDPLQEKRVLAPVAAVLDYHLDVAAPHGPANQWIAVNRPLWPHEYLNLGGIQALDKALHEFVRRHRLADQKLQRGADVVVFDLRD